MDLVKRANDQLELARDAPAVDFGRNITGSRLAIAEHAVREQLTHQENPLPPQPVMVTINDPTRNSIHGYLAGTVALHNRCRAYDDTSLGEIHFFGFRSDADFAVAMYRLLLDRMYADARTCESDPAPSTSALSPSDWRHNFMGGFIERAGTRMARERADQLVADELGLPASKVLEFLDERDAAAQTALEEYMETRPGSKSVPFPFFGNNEGYEEGAQRGWAATGEVLGR